MLNIPAVIVGAIKQELETRDISQRKLALELGVSQQHLNYILREERAMGIDFLGRAINARPEWAALLDSGRAR